MTTPEPQQHAVRATGGIVTSPTALVGEAGCYLALPPAEEIMATMRRVLDALPRPAIYVHPVAADRIREAVIRLPLGMPIPEVVENELLPEGQAVYVQDTRKWAQPAPTGEPS